MKDLQKLKKEIQTTLDQERSNIFEGHQDESNLQGWIEALEYCIREIELIAREEECDGVCKGDSSVTDCYGDCGETYPKEEK